MTEVVTAPTIYVQLGRGGGDMSKGLRNTSHSAAGGAVWFCVIWNKYIASFLMNCHQSKKGDRLKR